MKTPVYFLVSLMLTVASGAAARAAGPSPEPVNPFYAMDTGVWGWKDRTPEQVIGMLQELGYDGYGHSGTQNIPEYVAVCKEKGLRFFNTYVGLDLDRDGLDPALLTAARQLEGTGAMLWMPVISRRYDRARHDGDEAAVRRLRELADAVQPLGVKIALYPHTSFYVETVEDAVRIAEQVNRRNVGVTFNLCHHLRMVGEPGMEAHLIRAIPRLFQVSINGADSGDTTRMDWDRLIQPLDAGTYDVGRFVALVRGLGYRGPIGLQGYGIPGDPRANLRRSIQAWKALTPPTPPRDDLRISGVAPHLTTYGVYSQNGAHHRAGHDECGIGAVVPWAGRLWMVNYAPHQPRGSEHKLYSVDPDLSQLTLHPESVGGTPAGRMIHRESNQLLIGHYLIDADGKVRVIPPATMPMRVTAITRHLTDPANQVYYIDMEGAVWEANVRTLAVNRLFKKPVPGWHGKGAYVSQDRLVLSNNGEHAAGNYDDLLVGGAARDEEERGVLAEWDGREWRIVERRQYTEVTGPAGIAGGSDGDDPIWAVGWDRRSLRLKLLDHGAWSTYLLPKAAFCNDASHGWYTEWPRIREITGGRWMMDMHGMFFDFPRTFSAADTAGIRPIGSHLRYIPDFCEWNGQLVLATDETSIQGNPLAGQPQSNLWFGRYEDLEDWGPASGYGGPWVGDAVAAHTPSDPFLIAGFDQRVLHLATKDPVTFTLQLDRKGEGKWVNFQSVTVPGNGYVAHLLPEDLDAVWLRLTTDRDCAATAYLHQTTERFVDGNAPENRALFAGLAAVDDTSPARAALVYAAQRNRNLRVLTADGRCFDFTKAGFQFEADSPDPALSARLKVEPVFAVDKASVILLHRGQRLRLPKGHAAFDQPFPSGWPRALREVESERNLANIHGTFYEVPLVNNGAPPAFPQMRPVASHAKQITDFCSWNGLLVLAGVRADATHDGHVFADAEHATALWFGGIDDLWKLGKPIGTGGPWKQSPVQPGVGSDPYLMTGYDRKTLALSHDSEQAVRFVVEVDFLADGTWHAYRTLEVPAGETLSYPFPKGFSAHWVRLIASRACQATAQFRYE